MSQFSEIGSPSELLDLKKFIFSRWKIELKPGVRVSYLKGVLEHVGQMALHFPPVVWFFFVAVWGRRCGKTFAAAGEILYTLALPGTRSWIVAPTYGLTDKVFQLVWLAVTIEGVLSWGKNPLTVVTATFTDKKRFIKLSNGSWVEGKSADSPKSLKGEQLDLCVIDECAFVPEEIFTEYLQPCLVDREGRIIFISTPRGKGWFSRYFDRRNKTSTREKGWAGIHCRSEANPYLNLEWLKSIRSETPDDIYEREYGASFVHFTGLIYPMYSDHFVDMENPQKGGHIYSPNVIDVPEVVTGYRAIDIGYRHHTVCLWGDVDKDHNLWVKREYYGDPSVTHEEHSKAIRVLTGTDKIFDSFISHDSRKRSGMDDTDDRSVQERYEDNGVSTSIANTSVLNGIGSVGAYLKATRMANTDQPKVYISSECLRLRDELQNYIWKSTRVQENATPEAPRKWNDDGVDAFRYMCHGNPCYINPRYRQPIREPMLTTDHIRYGFTHSRSRALSKMHKARKRRGSRIMGQ